MRFFGLGAGILFFLSLQQHCDQRYRRWLLMIAFFSTLIQTVLGFLQYYVAVEGAFFTILSANYVPYGVFQQVNVYSIYLAVGNLLGLYLFSVSNFGRVGLIALAILLFFNSHLTVLSGAGTAIVVFFLSLVMYLAHLAWVADFSRRLLAFLAMMAFLGAFSASSLWERIDLSGSWSQPQFVGELHRETDQGEASSALTSIAPEPFVSGSLSEDGVSGGWAPSFLGTRPTIYAVSLQMFFDEPLVGHGVGSFPKKFLLYQGQFLKNHPDALAEFRLSHPHNEPLYWVIEMGALSGLAFVFLLVIWFVALKKDWIDARIFLIASPLLLHSLLELPFYHSAPHFLMFFLLLVAAMNDRFTIVISVSRWFSLITVPLSVIALKKVWIFLLATYYALSMFLAFNSSDRSDISALLRINNPAAFKLRYEFELFQWQFRQAQASGAIDLENLNAFLAWAYSTTQYEPMQSTYESFISALVLVGKADIAREYLTEAKLMYPRGNKWKEYEEALSAVNNVEP
jgi:O-antigen polymerase